MSLLGLLVGGFLWMPCARMAVALAPGAAPRHAPCLAGPVARMLQRWGGDARMTDSDLRARLVALGPAALAEMIEVLSSSRYSASTDGSAFYTLDTRQRAAIVSAVAVWPALSIRSSLGELARRGAGQAELLAGLELLAACGRAPDLELAITLACSRSFEASSARALRVSLQETLVRIAQREPTAAARLRVLAPELSGGPLVCVVRALGSLGSRQDLDSLARVCRRRPELAPVALGEMHRVASQLLAPFDEQCLGLVRDRLSSTTGPELLQWIGLAGMLEDELSLPTLLPLLEHRDAAVREETLRSLRAISRSVLPPLAEPWLRWFSVESAWWRDEAEPRVADLWSGDTITVVSALHAISEHELFRHEMSDRVGAYLLAAPHELAPLVCAVLAQFRSGAGLPHLRAALERPEPIVRDAANEALLAILGQPSAARTHYRQ